MLEHDGVTQQQVRSCEAGYLVVREVPRHNAQQWANRLLAYHGLVRVLSRQVLICEQLVRMLGIVAIDIGNNLHFSLCPTGQLAHFTTDVVCQLIDALFIKVCSAGQNRGTLLDASTTPCIVGRGGTV